MDTRGIGALARNGLTFSELCALYFSRALLECFAGTHLLADLQSALGKFEVALTPQMKKFLDRLPRAIKAKGSDARRAGLETYKTTSRLLEAILVNQVVAMRYHSQASRRVKEYVIHPYRLVYAQGGLYLMAFVPAYAEIRTFAVERIRRLSPQKDTFTPVGELESDPFQHSLGVHYGPTTRVQLRFHPEIASRIKERTWHASQRLADRSEGSVVMTLQVCDDYALRSWTLGFGRYVRVLAGHPTWQTGRLTRLRHWAVLQQPSHRAAAASEIGAVGGDLSVRNRIFDQIAQERADGSVRLLFPEAAQ
jgi:predicted DNA-binding transcriptional regulator YafY